VTPHDNNHAPFDSSTDLLTENSKGAEDILHRYTNESSHKTETHPKYVSSLGSDDNERRRGFMGWLGHKTQTELLLI